MEKKMMMVKSAVAKEGYFFDMETLTLYMSAAWEKKSNQIGSDACSIRDQIEAMFPDNVVKTEVIARKRKNTAVTYDMMRAFISIMPDADKNMAELERQIAVNKVFKSCYKNVVMWFEKQFPFYGEMMVEGKNGETGWNAAEMYKLAMAQMKNKTDAVAQKAADSAQNNITVLAQTA